MQNEFISRETFIRGARNPLNSWARMDSYFDEEGKFVFGPNDLDLANIISSVASVIWSVLKSDISKGLL